MGRNTGLLKNRRHSAQVPQIRIVPMQAVLNTVVWIKYDLDAICQDLINKQNMQEKKLISFPPKLVEPIKKSA